MNDHHLPPASPCSGRQIDFSKIGAELRARNDQLIFYRQVRRRSESLSAPGRSGSELESIALRLIGSTEFFETTMLVPHVKGYVAFELERNDSLGERATQYRRYVDDHIRVLLHTDFSEAIDELLAIGIANEERQQELMLSDRLRINSSQLDTQWYGSHWIDAEPGGRGQFLRFGAGIAKIGAGADGFSLGHEQPQHLVSLAEFSIADRLVSNEEWLAFMADGGYERAQFWSAEGWDMACQEGWHAPLYWESVGDSWMQKTLGGLRQLPLDGAVRHVSYFEAEAYANWAGARLPTEQEWEHAAPALAQVYGDVWQWTSSRYRAYVSGDETVPEIFAKNLPPGASMVLRGGASVTAPCHTRVTYRNVEHPATRTMFTGLRLARCG